MRLLQKNTATVTAGVAVAFNMFGGSALAADLVVRKNVVDLTQKEKTAFVNAVLELKNTIPEGSKVSLYDQVTAVHPAVMSFLPTASEDPADHDSPHAHGPAAGTSPAHGDAAFLPWHREYTNRFEQALQSVDPNVTIPYWDWTDPKSLDVVFDRDFLGTNGKGTKYIPGVGKIKGGPVQGTFSKANGWVLNKDINLDFGFHPRGTALKRFLLTPPADKYPVPKKEVEKLLNVDNYRHFGKGFRAILEGDDKNGNASAILHNYIHVMVGGFDPEPTKDAPFKGFGTMSFLSSPYDPVFWLHHANVDRIWAEWQDQGYASTYPAKGQPYGQNLNEGMWPWDGGESTPANLGPGDLLSYLPTLAEDDIVTPADTLDFREYGYRYDTTPAVAPKAVPEPGSTLGLLSLTAFAAASRLKRTRFKHLALGLRHPKQTYRTIAGFCNRSKSTV